MKTSKTALALGLSFLLCASLLSGCSNGGQSKASENPQQASSPAAAADSSTPSTSNSTESAAASAALSDNSSIVIPSPDGWTKVDSSSVEAQYQKDTASFIVKKELFKSTTLEDIAKEDTGYLEKAFDKAKFTGPEKMKAGGKDAIKVTFTYGEGASSMRFETILIMSGVSTYTITCVDLESSFDAAGFDKIINSIEFK